MFAVLAEDQSDYQMLKVLIKRIASNDRIPINGKGYAGSSELLKDGARDLRAMARLPNCRSIVVCHDADGLDGAEVRRNVYEKVIAPAGIQREVVAIVPVWELESWVLADVNAGKHIFGRWSDVPEVQHPENQQDAKEVLQRLCRIATAPKYNHVAHNQKIAAHLNLEKLYRRCASFRPLLDLVERTTGARNNFRA